MYQRQTNKEKSVFCFFAFFGLLELFFCPLHLLTDAQKLRTHLGCSLLSLCESLVIGETQATQRSQTFHSSHMHRILTVCIGDTVGL